MARLAMSGIHVLLVMVLLLLQMHISFKGDARSLPGGAGQKGSLIPSGGAQYESHVHTKEAMYHTFRTLATFVDYAEPRPNKSHGTKGTLNSLHNDIQPPH